MGSILFYFLIEEDDLNFLDSNYFWWAGPKTFDLSRAGYKQEKIQEQKRKKMKLQRLITYLRLNKWQCLAWDNCHLNQSWVNLTRAIDLILINTNGYDSSWMFNWNLEEFLSTSVDKTI